MDNGLTWSLITFNLSCLRDGRNNNSSTASVEDCSSVMSRSSTATSAEVRCWASNGHTVQWNRQKKKSHRNSKTEVHKH